MWKRFLMWWSARLPARAIDQDGRRYLERYFVMERFGVTVYLHRFVGSDPDTHGLHDHPWSWALSLILSGWYFEQRRESVRVVRWWNFLTGESFHRVVLPRDRGQVSLTTDQCNMLPSMRRWPTECWSLFIHRAARAKTWGFLKPQQIIMREPAPVDRGQYVPGLVFVPWWAALNVKPGNRSTHRWWLSAPTGAEMRASSEARERAIIHK